MAKKIYYLVDSSYDWPDPSRSADRELDLEFHPGCGHLLAPPPRKITTSYFSKKKDVLCCTHFQTVVLRRDLFDFLGLGDVKDLQLGTLCKENGELYPDHLSVWSPNQVKVRGTKASVIEPCEHCGRPRYFPVGKTPSSDDCYLTSQSVAGVDVALADGPAILIVSEEMGERLFTVKRSGKWSKLTLEPIDVVEHAIDGLPDNYMSPQKYLGTDIHNLQW